MAITLSPHDVERVCREADRAAVRLTGRHRRPAHEQDDLRQDLLADLLTRLKGFDPARGGLMTFAGTVFAHRMARLADRFRRERLVSSPVSLDERLPGGDGITLGDTVAEDDGYLAVMGQAPDRIAAVERRHDLARALGILSRSEQALCADLVRRSPAEICADGRIARAGIHRRVVGLRHALTAAGLRAA